MPPIYLGDVPVIVYKGEVAITPNIAPAYIT